MFALYGMKMPEGDTTNYFSEFKKAYYMFVFDKAWFEEINEIESAHFVAISTLLWAAKADSEGY